MPFIPNTDEDREELLAACGLASTADLFSQIPGELKLGGELPIPAGISENELMAELHELASWNHTGEKGSFLGGGMYRHYIPTVVDALQSRQEFVTAYTPYQPEASQGTLTAFFEFQTMVAGLTGMEVANASMYEGSSAAAEAVVLALNTQRKRSRVVISAGLHPHTLRTIRTYMSSTQVELVEAPLGADGRTDLDGLLDDKTACIVVQTPNFLGVLEDQDALVKAAHEAGALAIASVYPIALGILKSPGEAGFDVAVGDGQSLGVPTQFGGPSFGLFATKTAHVRRMPGRIVGQTVDGQDRRGFALTFQTREQHIRREKATSNICTNNALMALRGAIYMAAAGPEGIREVALHCLAKAQHAAREIEALPGYSLPYRQSGFFNELFVRCPVPASQVNRAIDQVGMIGGLEVARFVPGREDNEILFAFTELTKREEIDRLVKTLAALSQAAPVS